MKNVQVLLDVLSSMQSDMIDNYVIAGLSSSLLGGGKVRYFENSREHLDSITPHSHRFNFACLVLEGTVINTLWHECDKEDGDKFRLTRLNYTGTIGEYSAEQIADNYYKPSHYKYHAGEIYNMSHDEIHSIRFSRGAKVLFFEGPTVKASSHAIEPMVDGEIIRTLEVKDYMFRKVPE